MTLDTIVGLLAGVPLFERLADEQLSRLALIGEKIIFYSEQSIISGGRARG